MIALWAALAAADPPGDLRPALAPADVHEQYAAHAASIGVTAPALACDPVLDAKAHLCWRRRKGAGEWATTADLARWQVDTAGLRARAVEVVRTALASGWTERRVPGVEGAYFESPAADGWAPAAVLVPDVVAGVVGGAPALFTVPVDPVVLVWRPGHPELDRVLAVGSRKLYDEEERPVSPLIFRFDGERVSVFGEATPRGGAAP
jgi:hypothetical protein